jgi:hypothetical protein
MAGLAHSKAHDPQWRRGFIVYPSKFLTEGHWKNELTPDRDVFQDWIADIAREDVLS